MVKAFHQTAEKTRTNIRTIRQQARTEIKKTAKTEKWSSDQESEAEKQVGFHPCCTGINSIIYYQIQKLTDDSIKKIDSIVASKEKELR
jgi:ribosome recycling factor